MKKITFTFWSALIGILIIAGCSDHSNPTGPGNHRNQQAPQKRQFIWNAMNFWYFWQADVPKLADNHSYFDNDQGFQDYLSSFDKPKSLFQDLLNKPGTVDRFSYFIPNYKKFNKQTKGDFTGLGFEYGFVNFTDINKLIAYVQYVVPESPADKAGLKRGEIITKVDGTTLTINNYAGSLSSQSAHTLTLGEFDKDNKLVNDSTIKIQPANYTKDPVFYHTMIDTNGTQIGYLAYNAFHLNSHKELNKVFGKFESKGISNLILDLRYNPGGALITSRVLGSMISGQSSGSIFAELKFNKKRSAQNDTIYYKKSVPIFNDQDSVTETLPINALSISKLYILIGHGTASASEALISGLKPYISNMTLIGDTTIGKNHGEIVLYNSGRPYIDKDNVKSDTKFALSPMLFQITNKNQLNYHDGFAPNYEVNEINYLNHLPPLRGPKFSKDPLIHKAISLITGQQTPITARPQARLLNGRQYLHGRLIKDSRDLQPEGKPAILYPQMLKKKSLNINQNFH
jgi:C-terminal processing protease CtpA/Prc